MVSESIEETENSFDESVGEAIEEKEEIED